MTPLHILALSTSPNLELLQLLIEHFTDDLITRDKRGDIPIYYACETDAPLKIIRVFLESHKSFFPEEALDWTKMTKPSRMDVVHLILDRTSKLSKVSARIQAYATVVNEKYESSFLNKSNLQEIYCCLLLRQLTLGLLDVFVEYFRADKGEEKKRRGR